MKEQRMYVAVEAREDWINVDGSENKFYPHPTYKDVYASRDGELARKRVKSGKILLVPQQRGKDDYLRSNLGEYGSQLVHKTVLETFSPKPNDVEDWVADHINDRRYDARLSNLQWLTRTDNLKKRDEAGSLNKVCYVYDRVTDMVTKYESRLAAAEAINYFVSNMVTYMKKEKPIRGRYFVTDQDYLLPSDYYYIFKAYDLEKESRKANKKKSQVILNKLSKVVK